MNKINLAQKFTLFSTYWDPRIIGELNDQHVKLVKFKGEFTWHSHENEDELFLVVKGSFDMQFRDQTIRLTEGELIIVPRGIDHCPKAEQEVEVLLLEPVTTINTGNTRSAKTVLNPQKI